MGYTTASTSMFSPDMHQTPENVAKVLDVAGWTLLEAANATGIFKSCLADACSGVEMLSLAKWRLLLDKAGRRSFDHDEDAA